MLNTFSSKTPRLIPLPRSICDVAGLYWRPNDQFVHELAMALQGRRVLEIFAGNGYLAGLLSARGVDILATSILSSMDAHERGVYHPVEDMDAVEAVKAYGNDRDVLLMCWPTVTNQALYAAQDWGDKPIIFIGEFTDYEKNHLGGCATDEFFERFSMTHEFTCYNGNMLEKAAMGVLLSQSQDQICRYSRHN